MKTNKELIEIFGKDRAHFACTEYALLDGAQKIYAEEDGILLFSNGIHILYGTTSKSIDKILSLVGSATCFVCSSAEEGDAVCKKFKKFTKCTPCYQIRYEKEFGVPVPENTTLTVLEPTDENIDFVLETYTLGYSREGVERIMKKYPFYATVTDGEISGYIGRHDEGSIGLLEIMPKFRRRGLGAFLVDSAVKGVLKEGKIAWCNIIVTNENSYKMHLKMNFVPSKKLVYWCS